MSFGLFQATQNSKLITQNSLGTRLTMVRVVKTKVEIEGEVHEETVVVERDEPAAWKEGRSFDVVGKPLNRVDGRDRVTGSARYTYDVHPAGLLYAAVLRSPHPHARIVSLDTSE